MLKAKTPLKRGGGFKRASFKHLKRSKVANLTSQTPLARKTKKEKTSAKLKKDLDALFSKWIRATYPKFCYTCGTPSEKLQCGHYISRQYLSTRWSKDNCRPQCWGCNGYGKGQPLIFEEKLKAEYGNDFVEAMKASRHQTIKLDRNWYLAEIERYTQLLNTL